MNDRTDDNRRISERYCLDAGVDFFIDADIVGASCLDVSLTGISFTSPEPLIVEMRLNIDGEREERRAKLVRAHQEADGTVCYGLEFTDEEMPPPPEDF
jgi:hypothetical protein